MEPADLHKRVSQMRHGVLGYCVLALLRGQRRYAVELVELLAETDVLTASEGTIYPLLSRLRRAGLVGTTWQESPSGPPRRYYELTPAGVQQLDEFTKQWRGFRNAVDQVLKRATSREGE